MDIELIKRMMDACYQGKRIRDMLPPLPDGLHQCAWNQHGKVYDFAGNPISG